MTESECDTWGRPYAKLSALKPGDRVIVDGDFDCMDAWITLEVLLAPDGLYLPCAEGRHYLNGQLLTGDGDTLVGIYERKTL